MDNDLNLKEEKPDQTFQNANEDIRISEIIALRSSIRRYSPEPIPRELIDCCLNAARLAPSACNSQPWSYIVIDDPDSINLLCDQITSFPYQMNYEIIKTAPVVIAVITESSGFVASLGGVVRNLRYNLCDVGFSCSHLTLQASALGLGSCILGWFDEKALKSFLNLGWLTKVDLLITLGYPRNGRLPLLKKQRRTLDEVRKYFNPK